MWFGIPKRWDIILLLCECWIFSESKVVVYDGMYVVCIDNTLCMVECNEKYDTRFCILNENENT